MEKVLALIGMVVIVGGAYLISKHKKEINWISVGCAFLGQIILAFLMIKTPLWKVVELLSNGVTWILSQSNEGIEFVFGGLLGTGYVFILNSLMPIVFISAFMGILFHFGIIQWFVGSVAGLVAKALRVDKLVATNEAVAFALPQFNQLGANAKAMMTVALCGFAGISSVGIQIAGFGAIAPNKAKVVAKYGFYALLTATFVNILTGAVISLML